MCENRALGGEPVGVNTSRCTSCPCLCRPNAHNNLIHVRLSLRSLKRLLGYFSVSPGLRLTWLCLHEASAEIYLHLNHVSCGFCACPCDVSRSRCCTIDRLAAAVAFWLPASGCCECESFTKPFKDHLRISALPWP